MRNRDRSRPSEGGRSALVADPVAADQASRRASIGIGAMIGTGIFSILGVVASISGPALPLSFVVGGCVALLVAHS